MFHVQEKSYNVVSTGFTIQGVAGTVYLADESINRDKGRIFFFTYTEGGTPTVIKKNAGTVDYMHGEILIDTVNITSTVIANNVIEIQAIPHSNDIVGLKDLYVNFNMSNTTIKTVQDLIASGENTSGSRFVHVHSYYTPTYTRNSKSPVSTTDSVLPSTASSTTTTTSSGTTYTSTMTTSTTTSTPSTSSGGSGSSRRILMIDTSIQRVEINQVIENQLPEFVQSESPLFVDFMKQYYLSQEYQGGSINIAENLDRYTKLQTYVGAALTEYTGLSTDTESYSDTIFVDSTKGYPSKYGLLKIDDEIITYTGIGTTSFTGCCSCSC